MKIHYRVSNRKWYGYVRKIVSGFKDVFVGKEIGIDFTDSESIREINKKYRQKDDSTDIISIEIPIDDYLGDIYLSKDDVIKKMPKDINFIEYNKFLIIHGILHLMGYDHENSDEEAEEMRREEIKIINKLKIQNPYLLLGDESV
jgi:probable rRNA maturation factor